jgi:hypothetical protein
MSTIDTVQRTQVDVSTNDSIRVYYDPTTDVPPMPSVSVVKNLRVDPEKEDALEGWRSRFDGQSKWARPWWKDQMQFKALRGTLVHFTILNELGDASGNTHFHNVGESDWGHEEYYAECQLNKWTKHAPSANTDEISYVPRNNKHDGEHAWDKAVRGMKWAAKSFKEEIIDTGPLTPANVIDVENFVFDTEYGYGGQYDLLYEDDNGDIILSDLKTSSAVRFDHKLQGSAYKRAIESERDITIDQCEVIRLHPDSETVEVSRSEDWNRSLDGLAHEFLGLADKAYVEYADALQQAEADLLSDRDATSQTELPDA